jgi:C-terminal processing protease CtpA/Prc
MKPILLIVLLLASTFLPAQQPAAISVADLQSDFDLLRKSLEEAHGGIYRFSTKQQMDARFDAARKKIASVKNHKEFLLLLYELTATTRDGHLRFDIDPNTRAAVEKAKLFPLTLHIETDRVYVLFNDMPAEETIQPGMELLTVNGKKINDLLQLIYPKLPRDGFIETGNQRRLERAFPQFYWLAIGEDSTFTVSLKDASGKTINAKLQGVVSNEREKNRNSNPVNAAIIKNITSLEGPQDNITLRFLGGDIACIRIRGFQGEEYNRQIDSVFKIVHDKKAKALILDLRNNGGGADLYGAYLVSKFVTKPFRYFDRIHLRTLTPSFTSFTENTVQDLKNGTVADPKGGFLVTPKLHAGIGEQQPAAQPFTGKTFILTNGSTFSTAADVCALMRHLTKAVFIGEETGGGFEGNTSGLNASLRLPYSKLGMRVQMYEYWNAVNVVERGRGTIPEHHVPKRITDLLQGTDAQINRAVELANTK